MEEDKPLRWLTSNPSDSEDKLDYVLNSPIGTIIAFNTDNDGVKSGAITTRVLDEDNLMVEVETEYGAKYMIHSNNVLWVKTGTRWPRWVYDKFKE